MNVEVEQEDASLSRIAAAIAEPARARMLCCLMDGHARTSTELAIVAEVSPSTASVHLGRLKAQRLVNVHAQGKHRYYRLESASVAAAIEALMVVAGRPRERFAPNTPTRLRAARSCYDHMAGAVAVSLHPTDTPRHRVGAFPRGISGEQEIPGCRQGPDQEFRVLNHSRSWTFCMDWSERRPHIGGALGAALLKVALKRKWVVPDLDSRVLSVTRIGRREMRSRFGVQEY